MGGCGPVYAAPRKGCVVAVLVPVPQHKPVCCLLLRLKCGTNVHDGLVGCPCVCVCPCARAIITAAALSLLPSRPDIPPVLQCSLFPTGCCHCSETDSSSMCARLVHVLERTAGQLRQHGSRLPESPAGLSALLHAGAPCEHLQSFVELVVITGVVSCRPVLLCGHSQAL